MKALTVAYALSGASDEALALREEVAFFQAVHISLGKTLGTGAGSYSARELAVQQLIDQAVQSSEVVDILAAAGLQRPDISILSEEFLAEVQGLKTRNLALEALQKLLTDSLKMRSKTHVVQVKAFTERLESAMARYHAHSLTTEEMIQELVRLAHDMKASLNRGEDLGLTEEEIAFYDALAENESAVQVLGSPTLKVIAQELVSSLKKNVTVDWAVRQQARARLRMLVRKILKRFGYPPDLQDDAVKLVLQQAESLTAQWHEVV